MTTNTIDLAITSRPRAADSALRRTAVALIATDNGIAQPIARLALGAVMLPHGLQKAFGLFGGYGFEGTMGFLTGGVGLPWIMALLVILIETVGAVMLMAGFFSRAAALGTIAVMLGAVVTTHLAFGFFMNWSGAQGGEGFEYHLLAIALGLIVLVKGAGAASLDRLMTERLR